MKYLSIYEKFNNYQIDDMVIVTNNNLNLNNRLMVISEIIQNRNGISYTVWNADNGFDDESFSISENDIIKKCQNIKKVIIFC